MIEVLEELRSKGLVTGRKHPTLDLTIYNYTAALAFDKKWCPTSIRARGLVLNEQGKIVALPLKKFFNYDELSGLAVSTNMKYTISELYGVSYPGILKGEFTAYSKEDGSCYIRFFYDGQWVGATRGSFESEQAIAANRLFEEKYKDVPLSPAYTWIFEYVAPWNRIVLDYKGIEDVFLLTAINTETGEELSDDFLDLMPFRRPKRYYLKDLEQIKKEVNDKDNFEGLVIKFDGGFRFKQKADKYIALHHLMTDMTDRRIFEATRSGVNWKEYLESVPDEFYEKVREKADLYLQKYNEIGSLACVNFWTAYKTTLSRKEFALEATKTKYPSIMFALLDKKPIDKLVWDQVEKELKI